MATTYYLITNQDETHRGVPYVEGLNIYGSEFKTESTPNLFLNGIAYTTAENINGFHFTTLEHIHKFYHNGVNLRKIELPTNNPNFKMVNYTVISRANMIIFGDKYDLFSVETVRKFDLTIDRLVDAAMKFNKYKFLEEVLKMNPAPQYSFDSINFASKMGHTDVLTWYAKSDLDFIYTEKAMNFASKNGQIKSLNWWLASKKKLKFTSEAIRLAIENGHLQVVEWWWDNLRSNVNLDDIPKMASAFDRTSVLDFWNKHRIHDYKCHFDFWREHKDLILQQRIRIAIQNAFYNDCVDAAAWWLTHYPSYFVVNGLAIRNASAQNCLEIMKWWKKLNYVGFDKNNKLNAAYIKRAINICAKAGQTEFLSWLYNSIFEMDTSEAIEIAKEHKQIQVLKWFKNRNFK